MSLRRHVSYNNTTPVCRVMSWALLHLLPEDENQTFVNHKRIVVNAYSICHLAPSHLASYFRQTDVFIRLQCYVYFGNIHTTNDDSCTLQMHSAAKHTDILWRIQGYVIPEVCINSLWRSMSRSSGSALCLVEVQNRKHSETLYLSRATRPDMATPLLSFPLRLRL